MASAPIVYPLPRRFHALDVLRGLAALGVVLWHWPHFYYTGLAPGSVDAADLPLHALLYPFYERGYLAVDFFYALSGFIFFWLYSEAISSRRMPAARFAVLRFSRLYPLHAATLLFVLAAQGIHRQLQEAPYVYAFNDLYHFLLHLFLASGWGFERGLAYNGPIWSVSIEVLLYAIFFAVCRAGRVRTATLGAFVGLGLALSAAHLAVGRGILMFFLGGLAYRLYRHLADNGRLDRWIRPLRIGVGLGWGSVLLELKGEWVWHRFTRLADGLGAMAGVTLPEALWLRVDTLLVVGVLFPATILLLAVEETRRGHLGRRFAFLGDISYSSYLLHFPLQLSVSIAAGLVGWPASLYRTPLALLIFFALLFSLCWVSYHRFERPAQDWLRRRMAPPRS